MTGRREFLCLAASAATLAAFPLGLVTSGVPGHWPLRAIIDAWKDKGSWSGCPRVEFLTDATEQEIVSGTSMYRVEMAEQRLELTTHPGNGGRYLALVQPQESVRELLSLIRAKVEDKDLRERYYRAVPRRLPQMTDQHLRNLVSMWRNYAPA